MNFKPMASLLLLSIVSTSYAKVIFDKGDWALDDKTIDRKNPGTVCIAYTESDDHFLIISRVKNQPGTAEVLIQRNGKGASVLRAELINGAVLSFANAGKKEKHDLFWNIPQNTSALIEQLLAKKDVNVKPADGSRDQKLKFSASGFEKVIKEMEKRCLRNTPVVDKKFEQAFLVRQDAINPAGVSLSQIEEMKRLLKVAYPVYQNVAANENELNKLKLRFKVQLDEAASLNALVENLGVREIPATIKAGQDNDLLEASKRSELQRATQDISVQRKEVASAQATYNHAKAAIAPHEQEHESRSRALQTAQSRVNQGSARIQQLQNEIDNARLKIAHLNQEVGSLNESTRRAHFDLRAAQGELIRADQRHRRYDVKLEMHRRLEMDGTYNQALKELSVIKPQLAALEKALTDTRAKVIAREAELRACQNKSVSSVSTLKRDIAQSRPRRERPEGEERETPTRTPTDGERRERPNRGDTTGETTPSTPSTSTPTPSTSNPTPSTSTPSTGPTTTTTPAPDCSAQQDALRLAQAAENDVEGKARALRDRVEDARARRELAERRVSNEVERELAVLVRDLNEASRRVDAIQVVIASNENRSHQINSRELPSIHNHLRSLESELPQVQSQHSQDYQMAARLNQDLEAFERQVGWNQKVTALNNATQVLESREQALSTSETIKRNAETTIANCQLARIRIGNDLVSKQQQKAQAENRLAEVKIMLEPYELERVKIQAVGNNHKNLLAGLSVEFEGQLPK